MLKSRSKENLVTENLALVHSLCKRFEGRGIEYDDLFGAGCEGLVKAAAKFDESKGFAFSTYAVPVILGEVKRLFRDGGSIKVSRSIKELYLKITKASKTLADKLGREPTVTEIAKELSCSADDVSEAICSSKPIISLTEKNDDGETFIDVPDIRENENFFTKVAINTAISHLDNEEKKIIKMRYFFGYTQNETAQKLNVSQVQISRNEKKILNKIRYYIE